MRTYRIHHDFIVQGEKIQTILKAANVNVESYWPGLFAKALEGINVKELITNIGSGVGAAGPAGAGVYSFSINKMTLNTSNIIFFIRIYLQYVVKLNRIFNSHYPSI
jgi:hypothetical protein